jgi:hypothetical protein
VSVRDLGSGEFEDVASVTQVASDAPAANVPAANVAAVLTFAAVPGAAHRLTFLAYSYSIPNPALGRLTVNDAILGNIIDVDIPIAAATVPLVSPVIVPLPPGGIQGSLNAAMVITLAAGGAAVQGKLSAAKVTG